MEVLRLSHFFFFFFFCFQDDLCINNKHLESRLSRTVNQKRSSDQDTLVLNNNFLPITDYIKHAVLMRAPALIDSKRQIATVLKWIIHVLLTGFAHNVWLSALIIHLLRHRGCALLLTKIHSFTLDLLPSDDAFSLFAWLTQFDYFQVSSNGCRITRVHIQTPLPRKTQSKRICMPR